MLSLFYHFQVKNYLLDAKKMSALTFRDVCKKSFQAHDDETLVDVAVAPFVRGSLHTKL